jgi:hypothetical protein
MWVGGWVEGLVWKEDLGKVRGIDIVVIIRLIITKSTYFIINI